MARFYKPDLGANPDSPFVRDGNEKLVRRSFWLDMDDRTLVIGDDPRHWSEPNER